ncbi:MULTISPECIES: hypothetical protein [Streptomyces]|uniref:hypothetical protein n=1 Tax=Streptomyces TaxID=1883 RepID=UPI001F0C6C91|nr:MULTISPECIES: hypothetical protein [Streptomyces]
MLSLGVPTPDWWVRSGGPATWNGRDVMVKPPFGSSSVGMSLVRDQADLPRALATGGQGDAVLVEDYLAGAPWAPRWSDSRTRVS